MKTIQVNFRILIVSILSFLCFTLSAKSTAELRGHSHYTDESRGYFCEDCGADWWCVGYDINNNPYNAVCTKCGLEYILDEEGNFLFPLRNNNN